MGDKVQRGCLLSHKISMIDQSKWTVAIFWISIYDEANIYWKKEKKRKKEGVLQEDIFLGNRKLNRKKNRAWKSCHFSNVFFIRSLQDGQMLLLIKVHEFPVLNTRLDRCFQLFCVQDVQKHYTLYFCVDFTFLIVQSIDKFCSGFVQCFSSICNASLLRRKLRVYHCDDINLFLKRWELANIFHGEYNDSRIFSNNEDDKYWPLLQHAFFWNLACFFVWLLLSLNDFWNFSNHLTDFQFWHWK